MGSELGRLNFQLLLAEVLAHQGLPHEGMSVVDEAINSQARTGDQIVSAELLRIKGILLSESGEPSEKVQASIHEALEVARAQSALSLELRAAISLCKVADNQDSKTKSRKQLSRIYSQFSEGFETADLCEARSLLEAT